MLKIIELTEDNKQQYLDQIVDLEQIALDFMKKEGRGSQLFITSRDDISKYIDSNEDTVVIAIEDDNQVKATAYITQGQEPFTYNDITKYFRYGEDYQRYVEAQYEDSMEYKKDLVDIYKIKLKAFEYAKNRILKEYPQMKDFIELLNKEVRENGFHEKSEIREKLTKYMWEYVTTNYGKDIWAKYEQFYWAIPENISEELEKRIASPDSEARKYENFINLQKEYDEVLRRSRPIIYEEPAFDIKKYFSSNTRKFSGIRYLYNKSKQ